MNTRARIALLLVVVTTVFAATITESSAYRAAPAPEGTGEGLTYVKNINYEFGTDMELTTIDGRDYAFAGSAAPVTEGGGLHVIDITDPAAAREVAWLKCSVYQADIQISHDEKTVIMAADATGAPDSCLMLGKMGFLTIDITDVANPRVVGIAEIPLGSHNITAHPTKPYVYNSDSELTGPGEIQIWSIADPATPKLVNSVVSAPHSPHDISFNKEGTLAVTAAVSHFDIFNTTDPENPILLSTQQCPGCSITHDAKFTPDGTHIFVGDEAGGGAPYPCPGGALYAYEVTGTPVAPVATLVGLYEPVVPASAQGSVGACTSHVFDISDDSKKLVISWYTAGTRYLDISDPAAITELGWFIPADGDSWSSKFHPRLQDTWLFANDINHGFDVYKIGAGGGGTVGGGGGGGTLSGPSVRLFISDRTPVRGDAVRFTVRLRECQGHEGTTVRLERKIGDGSYQLRGKKTLNEKCVAKFREAANYERATYKGIWPKQDDDHRRGGSRSKSVTTE
jgi:hypothetical protein